MRDLGRKTVVREVTKSWMARFVRVPLWNLQKEQPSPQQPDLYGRVAKRHTATRLVFAKRPREGLADHKKQTRKQKVEFCWCLEAVNVMCVCVFNVQNFTILLFKIQSILENG